MIPDLILGLLETLLDGIVGLLPSVSIPDVSATIETDLAFLWQWFAWANNYVPLDQAALMISILLGAWAALQLVHITVWVLTKLHILGGSS